MPFKKQLLFLSSRALCLAKMGLVDVTIDGGIQVIRLNRPERKNAINVEVYRLLLDILRKSAVDDQVVVTVLTGTGDYYSSGNDFGPSDIDSGDGNFIEEATELVRHFVDALIDYPKLVFAVVNGPAIGIGVTTLPLCDVVYASDKAWFRTPFTQLGIVPEACSTYTFPRVMGTAKASKLLYLNGTMTVQEALDLGLVTEVFPHSQLESKVFALVKQYAKLPVQSLMHAKRMVRDCDREQLHRANKEECRILLERFSSEDFFNAMIAFNQKKSKL